MAMAAERPMEIATEDVPNEDSRRYTLPIVVRNSFIDVEDKSFETDPRRSTSEPPSCRNRDSARTPTRIEMFGDGSTTSGSPRDSLGSDFASEERSHQGSPTVEAASPSLRLNPNAPAWNPTWSPMLSPSMAPTSPSIAPVFFPMSPSQTYIEPGLGVPPPPPPPPAPAGPTEQYPAQVSSQSRLNANAKAWQPSSMTAPSPPASNPPAPAIPPPPPAPSPSVLSGISVRYRTQLQAVLDEAKEALSNHSSIASVDVFDAPSQWGRGTTICAWMRAEDFGSQERDHVLKATKDLFIRTAGDSESVYVLGYQQKPFIPTDFGFVAMMGGMNDENKACWDIFAKGFCRREQANQPCKWQHPACQVPINVEIRQFRER